MLFLKHTLHISHAFRMRTELENRRLLVKLLDRFADNVLKVIAIPMWLKHCSRKSAARNL